MAESTIPTNPLSVRQYVDWDNDRLFDGALEDVTARTRVDRPFAGVRGRDQVRMLAPPMAGTAVSTLDNESRDYSPENTASPLSGQLIPGHRVRHEARVWNVRWEREVLADRPVGWWRGGDAPVGGTPAVAADASGNGVAGAYLGGATTGPSGVGGAENRSFSFNGTSAYVSVPPTGASPPHLSPPRVTVEAWVRPRVTGVTDGAPVVCKGTGGGGEAYAIDLVNVSGFRFRFFAWIGGALTSALSAPYAPGVWHHVAGTYDGATLALYVDSVLAASTARSGALQANTHALTIGARQSGSAAYDLFFAGEVDELAVYETALPQARISAHYLGGTPSAYRAEVLSDTPQGYWRLDEVSAGAAVADSSGFGRDGTVAGTVTRGLGGALFEHVGTAYGFPQTGAVGAGYVTIPHHAALTGTSFTVECWVYLEAYGDTTAWRTIVVKEGGAGTQRNYGLWVTKDTPATLMLGIQTAAGVHHSLTTLFQLRLRRWYHLAGTYAAGSNQLRLYADGELLQTQAVSGDPSTTSTEPLAIGGHPSLGSFPGRIDEVAVYNTELTAARIRAHSLAGTQGAYALSETILDDLPQRPEVAEKTASLPALGTLSVLRAARVSTALYQNLRTDQAFDLICDAAGIPKDQRVVYPGASTMLWWWLSDEFPWDAAQKLLTTEGPGAAIYEDGDGRLVFEGRQFRLGRYRSTTVQATFGGSFTEPWRLEALDYNPGLRNVINDVGITLNLRAVQASQVVYSRGAAITIGANGVFRQKIPGPGGDPMMNVITPVAPTDYTVTSGSVAGVAVDRTSGGTVTVTVTAGAGGAVLSGLQLRAQPVAVASRIAVTSNVDASASRAKYGVQSFPYEVWPELDYLVAQDFCDAIVNAYQEPRPTVEVRTVASVGGLTGKAVLARQISDRIAVHDTQLGTAMEAHIERISYAYEGMHLVCTLGCERAASGTYALWGTAQWDLSRWGY